MRRRAIAFALLSAALFGASTPLAKILLGSTSPLLLAGLLYLGAGISGAIQHRVGMQTAEHVVAINKDPDAPIGEFADLFVVGDLFQIVPALTEEIRRRKGK